MKIRRKDAFTLIELLVVVTIIAILIGLVFMIAPKARMKGQEAASLNNLRQLGAGVMLFTNDNDFRLPNRIQGNDKDKWPILLHEYLTDVKVYADPGDKNNFLLTKRDPLSNSRNNTSYFMNGFNDLGAFQDDNIIVRINNMDAPSQTILMAPNSGSGHFYMDFAEHNETQILNKHLYGDGSNYLFADGSSRFVKEDDYRDDMWKVHKDDDQ